jgi:5-methylcytosine-specific restriction endonuclease McrA
MDRALRDAVRRRAGNRCEYCLVPQAYYPERFQIDHIIAEKHAGPTVLGNLALCCLECNLSKGPNVAGVDPQSGNIIPLFNPRNDCGTQFEQITQSGRACGR